VNRPTQPTQPTQPAQPPPTQPTGATGAAGAAEPTQAARSTNYQITVLVLAMGVATYALAQSMVSPILPKIQHELHTSQQTVTWVLTAFLLSASVCTPILGRVGDMFGKQRVFVWVLVVFAIGSGVAAIAGNIQVMILGRVIQGVGGAAIPLGFGIVRDEVPQRKVEPSIGLIAALLGVGGGLGIAVAGPILNLLNYHWLFWLPMIVLLLSAVAAQRLIPKSRVRHAGRINWTGAVLLSAWLLTLLLGVSEAPTWGWASIKVDGLIAVSLVLLVTWITVETRARNPLIDMKMLRLPTVARINLVSLLYGVSLYSSFAFLPQFAQSPTSTGYGYSASITESGLIALPSAGATFILGVLAAPLVRRLGAKPIVFTGSAMSIVAYVLLAVPLHHVTLLFLSSAFLGGGYGLAFTTMSNMINDAVPPEQTGVANGMNANFRTIGGAIGAAVVSSLITSQLGAGGYPKPSGYTAGWTLIAVIATLATLCTLIIPKPDRRRSHAYLVEAAGAAATSEGARE
jgi:EmrB/QacA subfamily drug resistance transporter